MAALEIIGSIEPQREDEFTVAEFCNESGMNPTTAGKKLLQAVRAGDLTSRKLNLNGKSTNLYSFPSKPSGLNKKRKGSTKK